MQSTVLLASGEYWSLGETCLPACLPAACLSVLYKTSEAMPSVPEPPWAADRCSLAR